MGNIAKTTIDYACEKGDIVPRSWQFQEEDLAQSSEIKSKIDLLLEQQTYMRGELGRLVQETAHLAAGASRVPVLEDEIKALRSRVDRMEGATAGARTLSGSMLAWLGLGFTLLTAGVHALVSFLGKG